MQASSTLGQLFEAFGARGDVTYPVAGDERAPFQHVLALDDEGDLWIEAGGGDGDRGGDGDNGAEGCGGTNDGEVAAGGGADGRGNGTDDGYDDGPREARFGRCQCGRDDKAAAAARAARARRRPRPAVCRFRVCSRALRRASPVWNAMLFGQWKEGKPAPADDGGRGEDWVVRLPDDPPVAVAVVLALVHGRLDLVPTWPNRTMYRAHETLSVILSAADKYDVVQLFWPFVGEWLPHARPPYYIGGEDDFVGTLHRLNVAWQLGAVELVEDTVRGFVLEMPEEKMDGLLAAAEDGPSIGLSLSLREVLGAVTAARGAAIQSVLDFFHRLVEDHNYDPEAGCRKAVFGAVDRADVGNSAVVAALQGRQTLQRRRCNALVLYQIWGRLHDGWEEIPRGASDAYMSVNDLTDLIGHTLGVSSSPDEVLLPGHEDCYQSIHAQFREFKAKLNRRWKGWEPVLEPEQASWLQKRGDMLGTGGVVHECEFYD